MIFKKLAYILQFILLIVIVFFVDLRHNIILSQENFLLLDTQIEIADSVLSANLDTAISYENLLIVNSNIRRREKLVTSLKSEIRLLESTMHDYSISIKSLNIEIENIKNEYASMIYYAYRNRNSYDKLIYVLSAKSFNQSYKRLKYLQQYSAIRQRNAMELTTKIKQYKKKLSKLENAKNKREYIINKISEELRKIEIEKSEKSQLTEKLKNRKEEIENFETKQQSINSALEYSISDIATNKNINNSSIEICGIKAIKNKRKIFQRKLDLSHFRTNKGRMPWPVKKGFVYNYYGIHPHPIIKGVVVNNIGIDICTPAQTKARAIFDGIVSKVLFIPGGNQTVIISHDDFYTVYSNLSEIYVESGDNVFVSQNIGEIFSEQETDALTTLKFQIWYKNQHLDPLYWLYRK